MILLSCFAGILLLASKLKVGKSINEPDELYDATVEVEDFVGPKSYNDRFKSQVNSLDSTGHCSSLSKRSLLFVSTADGSFTCLNALSGHVLWTVPGKKALISSSISSIKSIKELEDVKFIPSLNGNLYKWNGDRLETVPLSTDYLLGHIKRLPDGSYVVGGQEVIINGLDLSSGEISYECSLTGCQPLKKSNEIKKTDIISLRRTQKTIRVFEPKTGKEKWNYSVGSYEIELIEAENEKIHIEPYCGESDKSLQKFKFVMQDGVVTSDTWTFRFGSPIAYAWNLEDKHLKLLNIFNTGQFFEQEAFNPKSLVYLGLYQGQMYVQHPPLENTKPNTFSKELLFEVPQIGRWRPLISTSPSRTPLLNIDKTSTALSSIDYPYDNGFFLYSNTTAIGLPIKPDERETFCSSENRDVCEFKTDSSSQPTEGYDFTPITIRDWWKEILALSIIIAIGINITARIVKRRFGIGATVTENQVSIDEVIEEAVEEIPQPITTNHTRGNSVSIATDPISEIVDGEKQTSGSSTSTLTPNPSEFTSRYLVDFNHLECLGKGGFGVVFKAKKKIDDCDYAIKRINLPRCEEAKGRMMREVKALAALEHPGIVRYFHAWWETPPKDWQFELDRNILMKDMEDAPSYILSHDWALEVHSLSAQNKVRTTLKDENSKENFSSEDSLEKCFDFESKAEIELLRHNDVFYSDNSIDSDSFIRFEDDGSDLCNDVTSSINSESDLSKSNLGGFHRAETLTTVDKDDDSFVVFEANGDMREETDDVEDEGVVEDEDVSTHHSKNSQSNKKSGKRFVGKCCTRNSQCLNEPPMFLYIQMQLCKQETLKDWLVKRSPDICFERSFDIFMQIRDAVEYFHRQGMMHRDLKPANIFFSLDGSVKVGDFGLVTAITRPSKGKAKNHGIFQDENHTGQVGTQLYMSPEQACGKPYSQKVDLYALGLIFFELLRYFSTQMERIRLIYDLKRGVLPKELEDTPQGMLVKLLTSEKPDERPEARDIKNHTLVEEMKSKLLMADR